MDKIVLYAASSAVTSFFKEQQLAAKIPTTKKETKL